MQAPDSITDTRERALWERLDEARLPRHVAVIMDGNGRWAKQRGLPRLAGHQQGVKTVRRTVELCGDLKGIRALTLYAFSTENWTRPKDEIGGLMQLLKTYLRVELAEMLKNDIRLTTIGHVGELPAEARDELAATTARTANNKKFILNLALNYGAHRSLTDAARTLAQRAQAGTLDPAAITPDTVAQALETSFLPPLDLLIRTSGELRLSNFLLWEMAYAEMVVTPVLWPDFSRCDFLQALFDFQQRERRFGAVAAKP